MLKNIDNVVDTVRTVAQAGGLGDDFDGNNDDLAHGLLLQRAAANGDYCLDPIEAFKRIVGSDGTHRAVMASVHRLGQIEDFRSVHFVDDDPPRMHVQAVLEEVAHIDLALTFQFEQAGFQT